MRLLSSGKICILIAVLGIGGAGALIGGSAALRNQSGQSFQEEGYITTLVQEQDQQLVSRQNLFAGGTTWRKGLASEVTFRNTDGQKVTVPDDSFIHYADESVAAVSGGDLADLDAYLDGVLGIYELGQGSSLAAAESGFQAQTDQGEKHFDNMVLKSSDRRYLFGSGSITVQLSGGGSFSSGTGMLEMYEYDKDNGVLQFTDGKDAWQVLAEGCSVSLVNGVTLDCETGELKKSADAEAGEEEKTLTLQEISGELSTALVLKSGNAAAVDAATDPGEAPVFNFTLIDGEDGADGEDGEGGTAGTAGEDGSTGTDGQNGIDGAAGAPGLSGKDGLNGTVGVSGTQGGVDPGVSVKTGSPVMLTPVWKLEGTNLEFTLKYEEESYAEIEPTEGNAYIYIYEVETGEKVFEKSEQTIKAEETDPYAVASGTLKMDTTYCLTVVDTYTLTGVVNRARVLERIFTTDASGIVAEAVTVDRTSAVISVHAAGEEYVTITKAVMTVTGGDETVFKKTWGGEEETEEVNFTRLAIPEGSLKSNTDYRADLEITYEIRDKGDPTKKTTEHKTVSCNFTTLKELPKVGGLTMRSEEGYLIARVLGEYQEDSQTYAEVEDPDNALVSVSYTLYNEAGITDQTGTAAPVDTAEADRNSSVYFKIDGNQIRNGQTYFIVAEYTWNDGSGQVTKEVPESCTTPVEWPEDTTEKKVSSDQLGRAFAACKATRGNGISLSFNGKDTGMFNSPEDTTEGTTYASIIGSLQVNLGQSTVSITDTRKLTMTVTDQRTYEKTQTFNSAGGKQGDLKGSFAIPLDLDGLLMNNTYIITLQGYLYDQDKGGYRQEDLGTLVLRTDETAEIEMGMAADTTRGTGVEFWLGAESWSDAKVLENYYDADGNCTDPDAYGKVPAAYRNLSRIVFELYKGDGTNLQSTDLIGTCTVEAMDEDEQRIRTIPGQSELYRMFYGEAADRDGAGNNVGVGESFAHRFSYIKGNSYGKEGYISENDLPDLLPDGSCVVLVKCLYDYTYDRRYEYEEEYDYFKLNLNLDKDDYVNHLNINGDRGCQSDALRVQRRPVSPDSMKKDGFAIEVTALTNENMVDYNGRTGSTRYDEALEADTEIGMELVSAYNDKNQMTKSVSYYGTTYDLYAGAGEVSKMSEDEAHYPFKFTFPMTVDGAEDDGGIVHQRRSTTPKVRLFSYSDADTTLTKYLEDNGYKKTREGDRGYAYYTYVTINSEAYYLIYTDFVERGKTYLFACDAVMDYEYGNNGGNFQYPADYYGVGWGMGKQYNKNTQLKSGYTILRKQVPQMDLYLKSTLTNSWEKDTRTETWEMVLNDPDQAIKPESLLGYTSSQTKFGGLYRHLISDGMLSPLYEQSNGNYVNIEAAGYTIRYIKGTSSNRMEAEVRKGGTLLTGDEELQAVEEILADMRKVSADGTTTGTEVKFTNLSDKNAVVYSWRAVYQTVSDYEQSSHEAYVPLAEHYLLGHRKLDFTGKETSTGNQNYHVEVSYENLELTGKISVQIAGGDSGLEDYANMKALRMVNITGYNRTKEKTLELTGAEKEKGFWISLLDDSFEFEISKFSSNDYKVGDELEFTFKFYYLSCGDRDLSNGEEDIDHYWGIKDMLSNNMVLFSDQGLDQPASYGRHSSSVTTSAMEKLEKVIVTGNDRRHYVKSMTKTMSMLSKDYPEYGQLTQEENLRYGTDTEIGYGAEAVSEYVAMDSTEVTAAYTVGKMAPTYASGSLRAGLTNLQLNVNVHNYGLMDYPEGESFHLYYTLSEVDTSGNEQLVGVMIDTAPNNSGSVWTMLSKNLTIGATYRVRIYYKDNRKDNARLDTEIFGNDISPGTLETGAKAKDISQKLTAANGIYPLDGVPQGYLEATTVDAITFDETSAAFTLDSGADYIATKADEKGNWNRKKISFTVNVKNWQDEHTKPAFILERCPIGQEKNDDSWKTILTSARCLDPEELEQIASFMKEWESTKFNRMYFEQFPEVAMTLPTNSDYRTAISMPVYPESVFTAGYSYRMKMVVFQYDENGKNPQLVSMADDGKQYIQSDYASWELYEYRELVNRPVTVSNLQVAAADNGDSNTLSARVRVSSYQQYNYFVDPKVYVRLCKQGMTGWEILDDDKYYPQGRDQELEPGVSYQLEFENLEPGTSYCLRFFALCDRDYDNRIDAAANGVPLASNTEDKIYPNLDTYYTQDGDTLTLPENQLEKLKEKYLKKDNIGQILLDSSKTVTTLAKGQLGTVGNCYQKKVNKEGTRVTLYFQDASGLEHVTECAYRILYVPSDDREVTIDQIQGNLVKSSSQKSLMDGEATEGYVSLTLSSLGMNFLNPGEYQVQLELTGENGKTFEKPNTITVVVQ